MADPEKDNLADALARMASGAPEPSPTERPDAGSFKPARLVPIRPASARAGVPAAPLPPKPVAPVPIRPLRPSTPTSSNPIPAMPTPPAPAAPIRTEPPAPASVPAAARKVRPSAPTLRQVVVSPNDEEVDGGQSTGLSAAASEPQPVVDDDDSVIMPAPEPSVFAGKKKPAATPDTRERANRKTNLELRRTLIPILLTCSLLMMGFGLLRFFSSEDSMLGNLPIWVPIVLFVAAVILLALSAVNMMSVKHQLEAESKSAI